jgi:hypothetical protein
MDSFKKQYDTWRADEMRRITSGYWENWFEVEQVARQRESLSQREYYNQLLGLQVDQAQKAIYPRLKLATPMGLKEKRLEEVALDPSWVSDWPLVPGTMFTTNSAYGVDGSIGVDGTAVALLTSLVSKRSSKYHKLFWARYAQGKIKLPFSSL